MRISNVTTNPYRLFGTVAAVALFVAWSAGQAPAAPNAYQIFANARAYWLQQRYPERLNYTIAVGVVEGGHERVERYHADYDAVRDIVTVDPFSDYQREHPTRVSGVNVGFLFWSLTKPLPPIDFLGVPHLAPNYSFGMAPFVPAPSPTPFNSAALVAEIRQEFHDPNPRAAPSPTPSQRGLREIATVVAHNRDYQITLLGVDTVDGHPCYHLGLTPTHDPGRYRIRQAWIDEATYAPWKIQDALNFTNGPATGVAWTILFDDVDGSHYVKEEDATAPMATRGEIYTHASVRFEHLRAANSSDVRPQLVPDAGTILSEPPWPEGKHP